MISMSYKLKIISMYQETLRITRHDFLVIRSSMNTTITEAPSINYTYDTILISYKYKLHSHKWVVNTATLQMLSKCSEALSINYT